MNILSSRLLMANFLFQRVARKNDVDQILKNNNRVTILLCQVRITKANNVSDNPKVAGRYGVMGLPTLILFKDGQPFSNIVGFRSKDELKCIIDTAF